MLGFKIIIALLVVSSATAGSKNFRSSKLGLRVGGKACVSNPNYCKNGGTCYSTVTFQTVAPLTTRPVEVPVCGCLPAYQGQQCQIPVTAPPTPAPTPACPGSAVPVYGM